jgi:hypothetical protein
LSIQMFFLPMHSFKQTLFLIHEVFPHMRQCRMQPGEPTSPTGDDCVGDYGKWRKRNLTGCHSERSEESARGECGFFAALRMTASRDIPGRTVC